MISFWRNLLRLRQHIRIPWGYLAGAVCLMALLSILGGISITALAPLFDRVLSGQPFALPATLPAFLRSRLEPLAGAINAVPPATLLRHIVIFIFLAVTAKCLFAYLNICATSRFSLQAVTVLRGRVFEKYLRAVYGAHQQKKAGERLSHFTYDINILGACLQTPLPQLVLNLMQAAAYFSVALAINWRLTAISFLIVPLLILPVVRIGATVRKLAGREQESIGALNNAIRTVLANLPVVRAFVAEEREKSAFRSELENFFRVSYRSVRRRGLLSQLTEIITTVAGLTLVYFGFREIEAGTLTSGIFLAFLVALFAIFSPLKTVVSSNAHLEQANAVFPRLFSVLETEEEQDAGTRAASGPRQGISFENVSFAYGKKQVLDDVSFTIGKGQTIGIVGESGVGKSTIISLLLRFYRPDGGRILLDGVPVEEYALAGYRKIFGLVSQEPLVFGGTIAENIAYARPGASEAEIRAAAAVANLDRLIARLPEGYRTPVGESGATLSGGEKQRLAIARAVLADPSVFILDEATSNLDSESERLVQEAMERIISGRTCLVIAHRFSTLAGCDWIIVLDNGKIIEEGTNDDLLARKGRYHRAYSIQAMKKPADGGTAAKGGADDAG